MRMMKYLVVELPTLEERMYLFSQDEQHKDFAQRLNISPVRGGCVQMIDGRLKCFGEAFSLGLYGDKQKDGKLLNHMINDDLT